MKEKVRKKQDAYAALSNSTLGGEKEVREARYRSAKKLAKNAIAITKNNAYRRL